LQPIYCKLLLAHYNLKFDPPTQKNYEV